MTLVKDNSLHLDLVLFKYILYIAKQYVYHW